MTPENPHHFIIWCQNMPGFANYLKSEISLMGDFSIQKGVIDNSRFLKELCVQMVQNTLNPFCPITLTKRPNLRTCPFTGAKSVQRKR